MSNKCVLLVLLAIFLATGAVAGMDGASKDPKGLSKVESGSENIKIVGDQVFIRQGGREIPASNGTYKLQDGTSVTVVNGRITAKTPGAGGTAPINKSQDNIKMRY